MDAAARADLVQVSQAGPRLPEWLRKPHTNFSAVHDLKTEFRRKNLHTVCESARCPNIHECFARRAATFMILGDVCTRACSYCAVAHGRPAALDRAEPERVASAIQTLGLSYVVITSVDRDDLPDGGASVFADTIRETRARAPECRLEVLIPDFQGNAAALQSVLDARPDILNHNTETVPRLYRTARSGGRYSRTMELLDSSTGYSGSAQGEVQAGLDALPSTPSYPLPSSVQCN